MSCGVIGISSGTAKTLWDGHEGPRTPLLCQTSCVTQRQSMGGCGGAGGGGGGDQAGLSEKAPQTFMTSLSFSKVHGISHQIIAFHNLITIFCHFARLHVRTHKDACPSVVFKGCVHVTQLLRRSRSNSFLLGRHILLDWNTGDPRILRFRHAGSVTLRSVL